MRLDGGGDLTFVAFWWGHYNLDRGETGSETGGDVEG